MVDDMELAVDVPDVSDLEQKELEGSPFADPVKLMIGHLLKDELKLAQLLSMRTTDQSELLQRTWQLGEHLIARKPVEFYLAAKQEWPDEHKVYVDMLVQRVKQRMLLTIAKSYSHIRIENAMKLTDLSKAEVIDAAKQRGWAVDEQNSIISPVPPQPAEDQRLFSEEQVAKFSEFVSFLDT